jgi:mannosyltransferase OCH1-like enzyme
MIPRNIHQTWKTENIPDNWKHSVNSCIKIHKGFTYILWTDEKMDRFVSTYYPHFYKIYKSYKYHIQRCDAFRYLVLYKYGGIYLDMDITCKEKLDTFLDYDLVLSRSSNIKKTFTNSFFMVKPKHDFFKYCIDNLYEHVNSYENFGKHLHVMHSTGPLFLNNMVNKYGKIENVYILNNEEFAGDCNICNENACNGGIYFSHVTGQTWNEFDSKFYNFLLCDQKKVLIFLILLFLIYKI